MKNNGGAGSKLGTKTGRGCLPPVGGCNPTDTKRPFFTGRLSLSTKLYPPRPDVQSSFGMASGKYRTLARMWSGPGRCHVTLCAEWPACHALDRAFLVVLVPIIAWLLQETKKKRGRKAGLPMAALPSDFKLASQPHATKRQALNQQGPVRRN